MLKPIQKIRWIVKRHPYLYYTRFKLLSKKAAADEAWDYSYNTINQRENLPTYFKTINLKIFEETQFLSDFDKTLYLAKWLRMHIKGGSGLSLSSEKALKKMLKGEGGVCSDIAQVFNNFCVLNDIKVREWGITSLPYKNKFGGHAVNEFYSDKHNKWVLIDVAKSLMFYEEDSEEPLSVLELFENNKEKKRIVFRSFLSSNPIDYKLIKDYYLHTERMPFLICNYRNNTYDWYLDKFQPYLPIFVIHFWLYLAKKSYYYLFPLQCYKNNLA
ncbi:transglutaminase domain-containing protein [Snuella sedimenti]|uniref:Transglutaminase domain-containing protein n=1 Tax=Snuella sedimenti TaxID=2798802 RepID=A0A8J7LTF2_9FLAO|nr:transglutaminase domain-containing protein [Snuella sedimenti]MBJ6368286.1 transglutaminase domain-containing protein [Snuella sedimenti]